MKDAHERFEEYQRRDSVKLKMAITLLTEHCHTGMCGNCPITRVSACRRVTEKDWEDYFEERWRVSVGRTV